MCPEILPSASPEEAAAISAAVQRFETDTAVAPPTESPGMNPWLRTALEEGVSAGASFGPPPHFGEV